MSKGSEAKTNDTTNNSNKKHEMAEDSTSDSSVYEKTIASLKRDFKRAASFASVKNITEVRRKHFLDLI